MNKNAYFLQGSNISYVWGKCLVVIYLSSIEGHQGQFLPIGFLNLYAIVNLIVLQYKPGNLPKILVNISFSSNFSQYKLCKIRIVLGTFCETY